MSKVLVSCADYNGHKNVLFMMNSDDYRLKSKNWLMLDNRAKYHAKSKTLHTLYGIFQVFEDWSLKQISSHID